MEREGNYLCDDNLPGTLDTVENDIILTTEDKKEFRKLLKQFKKAHRGWIIGWGDDVPTK